MRGLIAAYAQERSTITANRLVRLRDSAGKLVAPESIDGQVIKPVQPARILDENLTELYNQFPFKSELSKSTFIKYVQISGQFKKPHRLSDLCEYCEIVG